MRWYFSKQLWTRMVRWMGGIELKDRLTSKELRERETRYR